MGARAFRPRAHRDRVGVPGRGHDRDAHRDPDAPGHPDPVPGDGLPVRGDARVQGAAGRADVAERGRPGRHVHGRASGGGDGTAPVRTRPGDVLRPEQGATDVRGAPRPGRVDHRVPAGIIADARHRAVRAAVRAGARPLDRQGEPDGRVVGPRRLGVPEGARPPAQPALRPRVQLDRVCTLHADAPAGRAGARGTVGGPVEVGVRDPGDAGADRGPGRSRLRPRPRGPRARAEPPGGGGRRASRRPPAPGTDRPRSPARARRRGRTGCRGR